MARTVNRWVRFVMKGADATMREIPVDSISGITLNYDVVEMSAWQDAAKGFLPGLPVVKIQVGGPWDTAVVAAVATSGNAPTLSGSHTVLSAFGIALPQCTGPVNISLAVLYGLGTYWATGNPAFGLASASATSGFWLSSYEQDPSAMKYKATFDLFPGSTCPSWINAIPA